VYPNITFEEIVFHMRMPLEGTAQSFALSAAHSVLLPSLIGFAVLKALFGAGGSRAHALEMTKRFRLQVFPLMQKNNGGGYSSFCGLRPFCLSETACWILTDICRAI